MKHSVALFVIALMMPFAVSASDSLSIQDIVYGEYYPKRMGTIHMMNDGSSFTRWDGNQLCKYHLATGEEISVMIDLDSLRDTHLSEPGDYIFSKDERKVLLQGSNYQPIYRRSFTADYYIYDFADHSVHPLSVNGDLQIPTWSPDGQTIAFVRGNNIFIVDCSNGYQETRVTDDGKFNHIINGVPDWVNEEEFGFNTAIAFNGDGTQLCWIKYDETEVETYDLQFFKGSYPSRNEYSDYPGLYSYKYPKAGHANAKVSAWAYNIADKKTVKIELPLPEDGYIPRIISTDDADKVLFYVMNRHQDHLQIFSANPISGRCELLLEEKADKYISDEVLSNIVFTSNYIVLPSDRNGFMQLYLYDKKGKYLRQLTSCSYGVSHVYGFDEKSRTVFYQGAGKSAMEREIYKSNFKNTVCLTTQKGWNTASFSPNYSYFVHTWSDANTPFQYAIRSQDGKLIRTLEDNRALAEDIKKLNLNPLRFTEIETESGQRLNAWMVCPPKFDERKQYPVVFFQYSGPGNQQVINSWNVGSMGQGALYDHYFAQNGFIVICVDGRGTGGRGADFEKCTYLHIGELESKDQVEAALAVSHLPYVDKERMGIWGWSYGGFNTLMSMSEGRPVYKAGVAVAPPTNWKYYDSIYTERFMRTPEENPEGYDCNPIERAANLHGALLICHGLADDNVHPQNTFEYSEALVQCGKDFRELIYTNRNHSIYGGNTRRHLLTQIYRFFESELKTKN